MPTPEGVTLRELVASARDRYRELGACLHPSWSTHLGFLYQDDPEAVLALDGEALAVALGELAEALEQRGRPLDAACCWGQVASYHSKFNPYIPPDRDTLRPALEDFHGLPQELVESLSPFWLHIDHPRAVPAFGRAGMAFLAAHELLGERAEERIVRGRVGGPYRSVIMGYTNIALLDLGQPPSAAAVRACFYRLQPLMCARGALRSLSQLGAFSLEGAALELLLELQRCWDDWFSLIIELERVAAEAEMPNHIIGTGGGELEDDRRRVNEAIIAAREPLPIARVRS